MDRIRDTLVVAALVANITGSSLGCSASQRVDDPYAGTLPVAVRGDYAVFAQRCSRCHLLDRVLSAGVNDMEHWRRYVDRMRMMQNSGISVEDTGPILRYLQYHTERAHAESAQESR